jgi:hypothetical protein
MVSPGTQDSLTLNGRVITPKSVLLLRVDRPQSNSVIPPERTMSGMSLPWKLEYPVTTWFLMNTGL